MKFKKPDFKKPELKKPDIKLPDFSKLKGKLHSSQGAMKSMKSYNWAGAFKKITSSQSSKDLNVFLEKMPQTAGQTMLIIAGVAWAVAGATGLYTTVQIQKLTELRSKLEEAQALKPAVPVIKEVSVNADEITDFLNRTTGIYTSLDVRGSSSNISITGTSTGQFAAFREAISHVQNGGSGWRVNIEHLCVGRECDGKPLQATLNINKVSVDKPG